MELTFDISEDELPIFLGETDEQVETLDQGLVQLEQKEDDPELLQSIFRAAHTLKGSAGMIGHKRMVELTHAMETALDGLRKNTFSVSQSLIDLCLDAVDAIRFLRDEVITHEVSSVDIEVICERFTNLSQSSNSPDESTKIKSETIDKPVVTNNHNEPIFIIEAQISQDSIATSARAFQLMIAIQGLGEILEMSPSQEQIETASPVDSFRAELSTSKSESEIHAALASIDEVEHLEINFIPPSQDDALESEEAEEFQQPPRLGDFLVENGYITQEQLDAAIKYQSEQKEEKQLLGQVLVKLEAITPVALDEAVSKQLIELRSALEAKGKTQTQTVERAQVRATDKTVRTSVERLDILMNLVGELITDRNSLYQIRSQFESKFRGNSDVEYLSETIAHVGRITDQLQSEIMSIRMLPISNVFNKFPRLVRDLARKADKDIQLITEGEDTELDRSVIEEINDPLIHLLRNSVDHGIEQPEDREKAGKPRRGVITLTAKHEQGHIILTINDDGRGIDTEIVRASVIKKGMMSKSDAEALSEEEVIDLIFMSGLSTAKKVSDISGRGVGMDIVRTNIERLNGNILVETWPGRGTQFQIVLPLTLAIVPTLLVGVENATYAIPIVTISETLSISTNEIQTINSRPVIYLRDHVLPVIRLKDVFDNKFSKNGNQSELVVVVRSGKSEMGIIVDSFIGEQEVVVKSLSTIIGDVVGVSSAAILGDGRVTLIVDVQELFKLAIQRQYK